MDRVKHILLYHEPPASVDPAFRYALRLAKLNHAKITVAGCLPQTLSWAKRLAPGTRDPEALVHEEHQRAVETAAQWVRNAGVEVAVRVLVGDPAVEITREVLREDIDLVIKTAQGGGGHKEESLFGTTATNLMRICPALICIVDPMEDARFERVLAAVDLGDEKPEHARFNHKLLGLAADLAKETDGDLHLLYAWPPYGETLLSAYSSAAEMRRYADDLHHKAEQRMREFLATANCHPRLHVHVVKGEAEEVIARFTSEHEIDIAVMGTIGRRGLQGWLLGNTAERVVQHVRCSVLAVKPDGFVCPFRLQKD